MADTKIDEFAQSVIDATGPKASPRAKEIVSSLVKHLHAFARDVDLTIPEWLAACDLLIEAGQVSNDRRNEMILVSDIFGLESLVDSLQHERNTKANAANDKTTEESTVGSATDSAILGPFYRDNAPKRKNGESIVLKHLEGSQYAHLSGRVTDETGKPIKGATVDIWHCGPNGLYEQQDPDQPEWNYRGRFTTDDEGNYAVYCLRPTPYPIPFDHSAGKILQMLDRHPYRPAHIHFYVYAEGHHSLVTQLFDSTSKYLDDDATFSVKDSLVIEFKPLPKGQDPKAEYEVHCDIVLASTANK